MTQPSTPMLLAKKSQDAVLEYHRQCYNMLNAQWNLREQMRTIDLAYIREKNRLTENLKAKRANKYGDQNRYQDLTIPVVMPQVESAVVYQTSVFLTGSPILGVVSSPSSEDEAQMMEAILSENATRGKWKREFMKHFRDGFKYNIAAVEVIWDRKVTPAFESDVTFGNGKQAKPKEVLWEGNCIKRLDMYNTFFDSRVAPTEIHERGEFAGYTKLYSRIALKQFFEELPDKMIQNIVPAFESGLGMTTSGFGGIGGIQSYYIPELNPNAILNRNLRNNFDWLSWVGITDNQQKIQYRNMYEVTTLYARILPSDFGLKVPRANTPQVWKFIIVNHSVVVYAERQTNAHGYLPILFSQPNEDGLEYQTKSLADNVLPMQDITSAMMNSVLAARRRSISDRGLFDPSRVSEANINSPNPSAKIPVRPAAYGKPLNESYYPIPFNDDQSQFAMQQIGFMTGFANQISGQNPAKQGQFVKGNKTTHEFDTVMQNANGRDQMTSILLEDQLFTPLKEILKSNMLQYQGGVTIFNPASAKEVNIDPVKLRQAIVEFQVTDGLTPSDKLINADVMMVAMQQIGSSEQIGAGYNIAPLFSYLMKTQGAHLKDFEKSPQQMAYEQAMSQWQQMCMQMAKDNKEIKPNQYPPQPIPQQYGYQPQGNNVGDQQVQQGGGQPPQNQQVQAGV